MSYHGTKVWKNVNISKEKNMKNKEIAKKCGDSMILSGHRNIGSSEFKRNLNRWVFWGVPPCALPWKVTQKSRKSQKRLFFSCLRQEIFGGNLSEDVASQEINHRNLNGIYTELWIELWQAKAGWKPNGFLSPGHRPEDTNAHIEPRPFPLSLISILFTVLWFDVCAMFLKPFYYIFGSYLLAKI